MSYHATSPVWENATPEEKICILRNLVDDLYFYVLGDSVKKIITTLENHEPINSQESKNVRFIIEMAQQHPNILSKTCAKGHITSSALVATLTNSGPYILLNHHLTLEMWLPFGGHAEFELNPWETALREAQEESGLTDLAFYPQDSDPKPIDIDVHMIPARDRIPEHYHLDFRYLLLTNNPNEVRPSSESKEVRWVTFSDAMQLNLEENIQRFILKCREML